MFVNIGAPLRIGIDLVLEAIDVPKLSRSCMGVEKIVDSERGAPAPKKSVVSVEVGVAGVA